MGLFENYKPSASDVKLLAEKNLTLEEVDAFSYPGYDQLTHLLYLRMSLLEAVLTYDVKERIEAAIKAVKRTLSSRPNLTPDEIRLAQDHFVKTLEIVTRGNPYPGQGFTLSRGREMLAYATRTLWTAETVNDELRALEARLES